MSVPSTVVDSSPPVLELVDIHKSFGAPVLSGVDLAVATGEAVGIIGPNGAGKSTLLNIVAGEFPADAGSVRLDGADITPTRSHQRCRLGMARTAQIPRPFESMTVFENVLVGAAFGGETRRSEADAARFAIDALERSGLGAKANDVAGSLRMLDRRRLELARALATDPRILLLDEIGGGLTDDEVGLLVSEVRTLNDEGISILWIEHIVHALEAVVDRLVLIAEGTALASGRPADVLADPTVQAVYLGIGDGVAA